MIPPRLFSTLLLLLLLLATAATWLTARRDAEPAPPATVADAAASGARKARAPQSEPTLAVEMTAYTSAPPETDSTPRLTASGAVAGPGTAAVSRDLLARVPYGSQVEVVSVSGETCGGWPPEAPLTVADTMHPRIENHLDVWLETTEQARNWGRCQAVVKVESNEQ